MIRGEKKSIFSAIPKLGPSLSSETLNKQMTTFTLYFVSRTIRQVFTSNWFGHEI